MPEALLCCINRNHDVFLVLLFISSFPLLPGASAFQYQYTGVNGKEVDRAAKVGKILKSFGSLKDVLAKAQSKFGTPLAISTYLQQ